MLEAEELQCLQITGLFILKWVVWLSGLEHNGWILYQVTLGGSFTCERQITL